MDERQEIPTFPIVNNITNISKKSVEISLNKNTNTSYKLAFPKQNNVNGFLFNNGGGKLTWDTDNYNIPAEVSGIPAPDGTETNPSITFTNDNTSGLFRSLNNSPYDTNSLNLVVNSKSLIKLEDERVEIKYDDILIKDNSEVYSFPSNVIVYYDFSISYMLNKDISGNKFDCANIGVEYLSSYNNRSNIAHFTQNIGQSGLYNQRFNLNDIISISNNRNLTISTWINVDNYVSSNLGTIIAFSNNSILSDLMLYIDTSNKTINFRLRNTGATSFLISGNYTSASWIHIVVSCGDSGASLSINNGTAITNASTDSLDNIVITDINIGSYYNSSTYTYGFKGYLTDFIIYREELTSTEITQLYSDNYGYDIYALLGSSQMLGEDNMEVDIDDNYTLISNKVFQYQFDTSTITSATNPLHHQNTATTGTTGLWKTMCENIILNTHNKRKVLLIPLAKSSTSFFNSNWLSGDTEYESAKTNINNVMNLSKLNDLKSIIVSIGEDDADNSFGSFGKSLYLLYNSLRLDINDFDISKSFIIVKSLWDSSAQILAQNLEIENMSKTFDNINYINVNDLSIIGGGNNNFTTFSLRKIGYRISQAIINYKYKTTSLKNTVFSENNTKINNSVIIKTDDSEAFKIKNGPVSDLLTINSILKTATYNMEIFNSRHPYIILRKVGTQNISSTSSVGLITTNTIVKSNIMTSATVSSPGIYFCCVDITYEGNANSYRELFITTDDANDIKRYGHIRKAITNTNKVRLTTSTLIYMPNLKDITSLTSQQSGSTLTIGSDLDFVIANGVSDGEDGQFWTDMIWYPKNNTFIAISNSGTNLSMISSDGINWVDQTTITLIASWESIAYSSTLERAVAVASSGTNKPSIYTPSGTAWVNISFGLNTNEWSNIVWSNDLEIFCTTARGGADTTKRIATASDGTIWSPRTLSEANIDIHTIIWVSDFYSFYAYGTIAADPNERLLTSSNGASWTISSLSGLYIFSGIAWSSKLQLFAAFGADTGTKELYSSPDGETWTVRTAVNYNFGKIIWVEELHCFIATIQATGGDTNSIAFSIDGINWTYKTSLEYLWNPLAWSPKLAIFAALSDRNDPATDNTLYGDPADFVSEMTELSIIKIH